MKQLSTTLIIFLVFSSNTYSQYRSDTIQVVKNKFMMHGQRLTPKQLLNTVKPYDDAFVIMKKAKGNYDFANVLGFAGGFMVGWPIGTAIGGGEANWGLAAIGAGVILLSLPILNSGHKKAKEAVSIYNANVAATSYKKIDLNFETTRNGMGLILRF